MKTEINRFLANLNCSPKTIFAYRNALEQFIKAVGENADLNTETYSRFLTSIRDKSASTQRVYTTAVLQFYAFSEASNGTELKAITTRYKSKSAKRVVNFDRTNVEKVISYCASLEGDLLALRDRAFVLTLADTGLRISEACSLKCGDVDWQEYHAVLIGKGGRHDIVRFSNRAIQALRDYLHIRENVDPHSRLSFGSQPLFARHDIRASKRIRPISAGGMWKAIKGDPKQGIKGRIEEAGVDRQTIRIHDFRHYFVTMTFLAKRDLKLSQELARHESISTTNRYAHFGQEIDEAYDEIFNKKG
jgi:site-specific recombinase XerD